MRWRCSRGAVVCALVCGVWLHSAWGAAAAEERVEFLSVPDSRCQILSNGGQLRLVKNKDPSRRIKVRLQRVFANIRQGSLIFGELGAAGETLPLGCSLVDGKEQRWELRRAEFMD